MPSNEYFNHGSIPANNTPVDAAEIRAEFDAIEAGFIKLPTMTGNGSKVVKVNAGGTALETKASDAELAAAINAATGKATPVDADELPIADSAASFALKKLTWANLKATIKTHYDAVASTLTNKTFALGSNTVSGTLAQLNTAITDAEIARTDAANTFTGQQTFSSPVVAASATTQTQAVIGSQLFGFRNKIINGNFAVSQRGITGMTNVSSYTADRWIIATTGTALSWNVAATNNPYEYQHNALSWSGTAGNTGLLCLQRIESYNCRDLAGKTCSISFWMYQTTGSAVPVTPALVYSAGANDSWGGQTAISALDAPTSVPSGVWIKVTNRFAVPSAATTGFGLYPWDTAITFGAGAVGYISHVQLEEGSLATPFEQRPYAYELDLCKRYYRQVGIGASGVVEGTYLSVGYYFGMAMRGTPSTAILTSTPVIRANETNITASGAAIVATISATPNGVVLLIGGFAGLVAGQCAVMETEGVFSLSAEL